MNLREHLKPLVHWKLGDGRSCAVFSEPWFEGALQLRADDQSKRRLRVSELLDTGTGNWDKDKLVQLLGYVNCMTILSTVQPPFEHGGQDTLIFKGSVNGVYSVRKAYGHIKNWDQQLLSAQRDVWDKIWHKGTILPRVRLLLWKLNHKGLPLGKIIHARVQKGDPICQTCGQAEEDVNHFLFQCPFSRACWYAGILALKTDSITQDFKEVITILFGQLSDAQWTSIANSIWSLWRCRNDCAYAGGCQTLQKFNAYLSQISAESEIAATASRGLLVRAPLASDSLANTDRYQFRCHVDGSWGQNWNGGIGYVLYNNDTLQVYKSAYVSVCCPIQAEAEALREAVKEVQGRGIAHCQFFTDSKTLVELAMNMQPPIQADWRAYKECLEVWRLLRSNQNFQCTYNPRCQNDLADNLAKKGRVRGWNCVGFTFPIFRE